ncbi:uncharacterized protein PGTG_02689 [Puccinia graminis f. sp. tritici CRL 75-36-700-3]|uniref:Uncharacterized protein n=2 Tax=Puccinia graminis f. sp. tritici TaxID=56615 RepID=E3JW23_PUCGT|nr:uncharacterized protein PGTG_02689 [Puccinia graminis f. sp. tritici CRL 75-36-700-3]EFP76248.1 hypothetical protein PGTG_02689 [Puccinia graminis f. sp. tritici CRL 75-36-700-3]
MVQHSLRRSRGHRVSTRHSSRLHPRHAVIDLDNEITPVPIATRAHGPGQNPNKPVVVEQAHNKLVATGQLRQSNPVNLLGHPTNTNQAAADHPTNATNMPAVQLENAHPGLGVRVGRVSPRAAPTRSGLGQVGSA